jgi:hypothetical protein
MGIVSSERSSRLDKSRAKRISDGRASAIIGCEMKVEIRGEEIVVDAQLLGDLLDIPPADVPALMRARSITSICERGVDAHVGQFRLSFFYRNRRARLSVDRDGHILRRSSIDFGERQLPASMHRPGD